MLSFELYGSSTSNFSSRLVDHFDRAERWIAEILQSVGHAQIAFVGVNSLGDYRHRIRCHFIQSLVSAFAVWPNRPRIATVARTHLM